MTTNKKKTSASDVLRQEMQQPLVIPTRENPTAPSPTSTPITTNMTPPTNDDAQAKAAQEKEAKLQQQKFDDLTKQLNDAKAMIVKLSEQPAATPAKAKAASAIVKKQDTSHASLTARPTQSREETIRRRNNTDIGWLD
jgi:septal ring factor EnvC (AmiA/AmiB activator)